MSAAKLTRSVEELLDSMTEDNSDESLDKFRLLISEEWNRVVELLPNGYVPLPKAHPSASPVGLDVMWAIGAPHPFIGLDGTTDRRLVQNCITTLIATEGGLSPIVVTGDLIFPNHEDADALARAMTLGRTATAHMRHDSSPRASQ